jgi:hypothetical protein
VSREGRPSGVSNIAVGPRLVDTHPPLSRPTGKASESAASYWVACSPRGRWALAQAATSDRDWWDIVTSMWPRALHKLQHPLVRVCLAGRVDPIYADISPDR